LIGFLQQECTLFFLLSPETTKEEGFDKFHCSQLFSIIQWLTRESSFGTVVLGLLSALANA
jgi:hypothetical protein